MEGGRAQVHQRVVGRLLLLAAGVPVEEVVDLISYLWKMQARPPVSQLKATNGNRP